MAIVYKSIKEIADEWKISQRRVQILCTNGRIPGAVKNGRIWRIPADSQKPDDNRVKDGEEHPQYFSGMRRSSYTFLDAYASEVRSDIGNVLNYARLLKDASYGDEKIAKYTNNMTIAANRVLESTSELSKLIQLDRGNNSSKLDVVLLDKAINRFFTFAKYSFEEYGIKCDTNINISAGYAWADLELHHTLHRSIITNLSRFAVPGGTITLDVVEIPCENPGYYCIKHSFAGNINFDVMTKKQRYIRDAFIMNVISAINNGTQIQKIDEIETSDGYSFILLYKKASAVDYNTEIERYWNTTDYEIDESRFKGRRVLLAGTNPLTREADTDVLTNFGLVVDAVDSGIQLLSKLEKADSDYYDIVVLDIDMPNFDGLLTTKAIRNFKDSRKALIPVIAFADAFEINMEEILESGVNTVVKRPGEKVLLLRAINDSMYYKSM